MKKSIVCLMILCVLSSCTFTVHSLTENAQIYLQTLSPEIAVINLPGQRRIQTDMLIKALDHFTNLQEVLLYDWRVKEADMAALTQAYPDVFFGFSFSIAEHNLRTDMTGFSTRHSNESPAHTSKNFDTLRYCTRLEGLDLGHNAITNLSFIENLTELKVLIVALNKIEDISVLSKLENLQYLEIFRNKIVDISPLAGLSNLLDLNLGYNNVKDFSPLYGLKNLKRLWLYHSNGYDAFPALTELQEQLPDCYIDSYSAGTKGGWRKHPRYDTINQIFKTSVYKPFEDIN